MPRPSAFSWTAILSACSKPGHAPEAFHLFQRMQLSGILPDKVAFLTVLKAFTSKASLARGRHIHGCVARSGIESDPFISSCLVRMYAKCGSVRDARCVFDRMPKRDAVSWNVMISAYAQPGHGLQAFDLFEQMLQEGVVPGSFTFVSIIKACTAMASLEQGKRIHACIRENQFEVDVFMGNALIDMYAKCGSLDDARQVFDGMTERSVVSWNSMLGGYTQQGRSHDAVLLFQQMQLAGIRPDGFTFVSILKACISTSSLEWGKQVHSHIIESGIELDAIVGSSLVHMYAKCQDIDNARKLFDKLFNRDLILWNIMIEAYAGKGNCEEALTLFNEMREKNIKPDKVTFVSILKAFASQDALEWGRQIHANIIESGLASDILLASSLIHMYLKCRSMENARQVFNKMHERDVSLWNLLISEYVYQGNIKEALILFEQMKQDGVMLQNITFLSILRGCASLRALDLGKQVHEDVISYGFELDVSVGNALLDMYTKCGRIDEASQVFNRIPEQDVVSWTIMITANVNHGYSEDALLLFEQMQQSGVKPDHFTFVSVLRACSDLAALERGKQIHAQITKHGFATHVLIQNTLVDMYAKCGSIELARQLFNGMCERDSVSWNVMISAYAQRGNDQEVLMLFKKMQIEGVKADSATFSSILKACAKLGTLELGIQVHTHMMEIGTELDAFLESSLADMYAKCGRIEDAREVFDKMKERDVVCWNSIITGYAQQGSGEEAVILFEKMLSEGVNPNSITFVCVLSACSNAGLVDKGNLYFDFLIKKFHIRPTLEHYTCMVDLLGRGSCLEEVESFILKMPIQPNIAVWMALLRTCKSHGDVNVARHAFKCAINLNPQRRLYVLLTNIHAAVGSVNQIPEKRMMKVANKKDTGSS